MAARPHAFRVLSVALSVTCRRAALTAAGLALPLVLSGTAGACPAESARGAGTPSATQSAAQGAPTTPQAAPAVTASALASVSLPVPEAAVPAPPVPPSTAVPGGDAVPGGSGVSCPPDDPVHRSAPASVPDPAAAGGNPSGWPTAGPVQSAQSVPGEGPAAGPDGTDTGAAAAPAADAPSADAPAGAPADASVDHPVVQGAAEPARPAPARVHGRLGRSAPAAVPALPGPVAQATDPAGQAAPDTSADRPAEQPAPAATATADPQTATELAAPLRWSDASTRQLPLGAGLALIGSGLALVGYRMRRG